MHRINIVGSGTAGLTAAIYAAIKYNAEVNIYTDSRLGKAIAAWLKAAIDGKVIYTRIML